MKQDRKFRLFGDRVMVEHVPWKQGLLYTPDTVHSIARVGRVVAHGDGTFADGRKPVKMHVKIGDLIYFQTNAQMAASSAYERGDKDVCMNVPQGEVIAKVSGADRTLADFQVIGDWVLLRPFERDSGSKIVVPDTAKAGFAIYFRVEQKGESVELDIKKGDEVLIAQGYCHPVQIKGESYGFILKQGIHGVVDESPLLT